jgi:acylphosphatase
MENSDRIGIFAEIVGIVQGVGFRYSVCHIARTLGITGWVKNTEQGSVELFAEGKLANIEKLSTWLHKGPPGARIETVRIDKVEYSGKNSTFEVVYW